MKAHFLFKIIFLASLKQPAIRITNYRASKQAEVEFSSRVPTRPSKVHCYFLRNVDQIYKHLVSKPPAQV
uniref:Secreted protein n=1 Tax=Cannabis sativa TaxID=3483 RepID=A0A803R8I8_CANSA